jgi:hypothetical protein
MQKNWAIVKVLVLVGFIFLAIPIPAHVVSVEPATKWINTYGGVGDDEGYFVTNSDYGYVFVGITNSSGLGQYDVLLIKIDSDGSMEWNHTYGGSFNDRAYTVVTTNDGGYALAGSTNSFGSKDVDYWLIKVDSHGNLEWTQTYNGQGYDSCRSLIATSDGGYALLGYTISSSLESTSSDLANSDVWLVKADSLGNMEWNQTYGGNSLDSVSSIIENTDGSYALGCSTVSFGAGNADFWLVIVDSVGVPKWNQTYGGSGTEYLNSLVVTIDGGYALAGSTNSFGSGSADVWLVKVDSLGNMEWNQTYGGPIADYCDSMVTSGNGGYALACIVQPPTFLDGNFWLITVDSLGKLEVNQTYGVSAHHSPTSVLNTKDGNLIFAGSTRDNFGFRDYWLAKISEKDMEVEFLIIGLSLILVVLIVIGFLIFKRTRNSNKPV